MSRLRVEVDGIRVESDGPDEVLDALLRDAFEVRIPEPTEEEDREAGRVLAEWLRTWGVVR